MEEGLLSLKWNNHKSTFFHVLSILREKHTYTDVTLACDGRLYPAHKFVLSTCSEYFSDIFTSTSGNNIVIVLKDVRRQDLEYLLDYMYLGQVDVAQSELTSLIKTAECLRIKGLAIPDDEPQQTSRRGPEERDREGSPPSKKKRHLIEQDRTSSISSNNTTNRIPHVTLPPPSQQHAVLQRLQQAPLPQTAQAPPTSQEAAKSHPSPLPHSLASSQVPRSLQVPTSPLLPTSVSQPHPPLASPTQSTSLPVIKQEVADPPETPDVFMNESYDETDTKPDVSDSRHLEQDVAIAGPSGLQGSSDNWDGDNDLAGFAGGEGYSEGGMDDQGDSEVQGGTRHGVGDHHQFAGLHIQHRHIQHTEYQHDRHHLKNPRSSHPQLSYKRGNAQADGSQNSAVVTSEQSDVQKSGESCSLVQGGDTSHNANQILEDIISGSLDESGVSQQVTSLYKTVQATGSNPEVIFKGTNMGDSSNNSKDIQISLGNHLLLEDLSQRYSQSHNSLTDQGENLSAPENSTDESNQLKQLMVYEGGSSRYVCQWCGRHFDRISNLKRHVLLHSGIKPFKCLYCNYCATQKANVVQHLASRHRDEMRELLNNNINVNDILVPAGSLKR